MAMARQEQMTTSYRMKNSANQNKGAGSLKTHPPYFVLNNDSFFANIQKWVIFALMRVKTNSLFHTLRPKLLMCLLWSEVFALSALSCGCNRPLLHKLIDKFGSKEHEKPAVYHEYEGYSPGAKRSTVKEDFNRYYYYISVPIEESEYSEPEITFRQDYQNYEDVDVQPIFDEEQYWKDHPLLIDNND